MHSRAARLACLVATALAAACHSTHADTDVDSAASADAEVFDAEAELDEDADTAEPAGDDADAPVDAAQVADAGTEVAADAATDADAAAGPGNAAGKNFDTALRVEPGDLPTLIDERSADQVDYFVFHGEAGSFYELTTDYHTYSPDNVLALYDAERRLVAQNDDGSVWPQDAVDARLVVRLSQSGDYFVKVEDLYTEADFFTSSFRLLYYRLKVRAVSGDTPGFAAVRDDGTSSAAFQHDQKSGYDYVTLLGTFGAQSRSCAFQGAAERALIAHVLPGGSDHNGSSFEAGHVSVSAEDPQHVLADIDRERGQENIHPPIHEGRYTLHADAAGANLGDNPYYAVDLLQLPENPAEQDETGNSVLAGAEAIMLKGTTSRRGLMLSRLAPGDVDYYRFELTAGEYVRVGCEAESAGSGVRALSAELRNAADVKLAGASETPLENLALDPVQVTTTGTHYLRLSSSMPSVPSVEPWARCVLLINR